MICSKDQDIFSSFFKLNLGECYVQTIDTWKPSRLNTSKRVRNGSFRGKNLQYIYIWLYNCIYLYIYIYMYMLKFTSSNSTDGPRSPGSSKLAVSGAMLLPVMTLEHSWHKMGKFEVKKPGNAAKSCSWLMLCLVNVPLFAELPIITNWCRIYSMHRTERIWEDSTGAVQRDLSQTSSVISNSMQWRRW